MSEFKPSDDQRSTQCREVLAALRRGPQRTADFYALGVLAPARRILDLRQAGFAITTEHVGRIGVYVLCEGELS